MVILISSKGLRWSFWGREVDRGNKRVRNVRERAERKTRYGDEYTI